MSSENQLQSRAWGPAGIPAIYLYDGPNLLEEVDNSGNVSARYTDTTDVDEPLSELRGSATSYYQADELGSVTSLSNGAGAPTNTYTFDSFGKLTAPTGTLTNPFQYTGRESDQETGLYYYRARYYDPQSGRFVSEDPLGFGGGTNFFVYAENDPINLIDPTGLKPSACDKHPCDEKYPKNKTYLDFIRAHRAEAAAIAKQLDIPVEDILGLSGLESTFGTSRIAQEDNDYFGLHAPDRGMLPGQTGTDTARGNSSVKIPIFPDPGYATSGAAFQKTKGPLVRGVADPATYATILHSKKGGFGVGRPGYVADLTGVIKNFALRLKCIGQ